jgi:hypothetical protein
MKTPSRKAVRVVAGVVLVGYGTAVYQTPDAPAIEAPSAFALVAVTTSAKEWVPINTVTDETYATVPPINVMATIFRST